MPDTTVEPTKVEVKDHMIRFWVKNSYNVLLIGRHGIGKSQMVMDEWNTIFGEEGKEWKYLSAPTLDPWVDFVGIPTSDDGAAVTPDLILKIISIQAQIENGNLSADDAGKMLKASEDGDKTIKFIRPDWLFTVKAIMIDELNRSHAKVRNALMEAIQFHSINGAKLGRLEMVWAAINPTDDEEFHYDTDQLDAATKDRFPVQIYVKEDPSHEYFAKTFGSEVASAAVTWWHQLPTDAKKHVSPRRLEMLIKYIQMGGLGLHIIPDAIACGAKVESLSQEIRSASPIRQAMKEILKAQDVTKATAFIAEEKNYAACISEILKHGKMRAFWLPCMPTEKIAGLFDSETTVQNLVLSEAKKHSAYREVLTDIHKTTGDSVLRTRIASSLGLGDFDGELGDNLNGNAPIEEGSANKTEQDLLDAVNDAEQKAANNELGATWNRQQAFKKIREAIPNGHIDSHTAERVLQAMERHLTGRAQANALARKDTPGQRWEGALATINRMVHALADDESYDMQRFDRDYPSTWRYCLLRKDDFYYVMQ